MKHLGPLAAAKGVTLWHAPKPHEDTAPARMQAVRDADVVLLLVTADFNVAGTELRNAVCEAVDRHNEGRCHVVPIRWRACNWTYEPFAHLDALPPGDAPIERTPDPESSWAEVARRVDVILQSPPPRRAAEPFDRGRYLDALVAMTTALDADTGFKAQLLVEPEKVVVIRRGDTTAEVRTSASVGRLVADLPPPLVVAVLGDPGSGKSVLLRQFVRDLCERASRDPEERLPVYFPLARFTARGATGEPAALEDVIERSLRRGGHDERKLAVALRGKLTAGKVFLVLDGMDEMPRGDFDARVRAVNAFVRRYGRCVHVVACRVNDFNPSLFDVTRINLQPFNDDLFRSFLRRTLGRGAARDANLHALASEAEANALFAGSLGRNPFFLSLVLAHWRTHHAWPDDAAEVFRTWLEERMARIRGSHSDVTCDALADALSRLALACGDLVGSGAAAPIDALQALPEFGDEAQSIARVIELGLAVGVVTKDEADGAVRFLHPRMQEALIAERLVAMDPAAHKTWLVAHLDDEWMAEVFVMVARRGCDLHAVLRAIVARSDASPAEGSPNDPSEEVRVRALLAAADRRTIARLTLAGRIVQASPSVAAETLAQLAAVMDRALAAAPGSLLPHLTHEALLDAIRGALVDQPVLWAHLDAALQGDDVDAWRAAVRALTTRRQPREYVVKELRALVARESLQREFPVWQEAWRRALRIDPELGAARRVVVAAALVHGAGLVLVAATFYGATRWAFPEVRGFAWGTVAALVLAYGARVAVSGGLARPSGLLRLAQSVALGCAASVGVVAVRVIAYGAASARSVPGFAHAPLRAAMVDATEEARIVGWVVAVLSAAVLVTTSTPAGALVGMRGLMPFGLALGACITAVVSLFRETPLAPLAEGARMALAAVPLALLGVDITRRLEARHTLPRRLAQVFAAPAVLLGGGLLITSSGAAVRWVANLLPQFLQEVIAPADAALGVVGKILLGAVIAMSALSLLGMLAYSLWGIVRQLRSLGGLPSAALSIEECVATLKVLYVYPVRLPGWRTRVERLASVTPPTTALLLVLLGGRPRDSTADRVRERVVAQLQRRLQRADTAATAWDDEANMLSALLKDADVAYLVTPSIAAAWCARFEVSDDELPQRAPALAEAVTRWKTAAAKDSLKEKADRGAAS